MWKYQFHPYSQFWESLSSRSFERVCFYQLSCSWYYLFIRSKYTEYQLLTEFPINPNSFLAFGGDYKGCVSGSAIINFAFKKSIFNFCRQDLPSIQNIVKYNFSDFQRFFKYRAVSRLLKRVESFYWRLKSSQNMILLQCRSRCNRICLQRNRREA